MIRQARHILLIAAWALLVLPSCPCKVASLFGIDLHGSGPSALADAGQPILVDRSEDSPGVPCHCDEEIGKMAVLVDVEVDAEGANPLGDSPTTTPMISMAGWIDPAGTMEIQHPPPDRLLPRFPGLSVYRVYRL